jgi:hypothetical protein
MRSACWKIGLASAGVISGCTGSGPTIEDVDDSGSAVDTSVSPAVFINEILAFNDSVVRDAEGDHDDWFELYNADSEDLSLDGWMVLDDRKGDTFSDGLAVPTGGFLLIWADERDSPGSNHVDFRLDGDGDELRLVDPDGVTVQHVEWSLQVRDVSTARQPDGGAEWIQDETPTPGVSNESR